MQDHPECEEELAKQHANLLIARIHRAGNAGNDAQHVDDDEEGGRDEQGGPLDEIELGKLAVVRLFGGDCEVGVNARKHLEEALEDGKQVGRHAANDPELLVAPQLRERHARPAALERVGGNDGEEETDEVERHRRVQRGDDELASEQADGGEHTVGDQGKGGEGVDHRVDVGQALQGLELVGAVTVPDGAMTGQEDLNGPQSPAEHLGKGTKKEATKGLANEEQGHAWAKNGVMWSTETLGSIKCRVTTINNSAPPSACHFPSSCDWIPVLSWLMFSRPFLHTVPSSSSSSSSSPFAHLLQAVRQVDGRGPLEGHPLGRAVGGAPPAAVHLEAGEDVLRDGTVDPPNLMDDADMGEASRQAGEVSTSLMP